MLEDKFIKITSAELADVQRNYIKHTPNLFLLDGNNILVMNSNLQGDFFATDAQDYSSVLSRYVEDIFVKNLFLPKTNKSYWYDNIVGISVPEYLFNIENRNTYYKLVLGSKRIITSNIDELKSLGEVVNIFNGYNGDILKAVIDKELLDTNFELGEKNKGVYFYKQQKSYFDNMVKYRKFDNTYSKVNINSLHTKSDILEIKKSNLKFGVESLTYKAFEGTKYTYGIEIETIGGRISEEESDLLNFKTVHDGSLRGPNGEDPLGAEYVTGVLTGDSGLTQLSEICRAIGNNCFIDKRCGVHVHIGSLDWNKEEIVFAYLLGELIEKDLFSILPKSRRNNSYCRPITKILSGEFLRKFRSTSNSMDYKVLIDEAYDLVYKEVAYSGRNVGKDIITSIEINKRRNHPKGSKCGYDKTSQRYCWLNFVTLLFDTKGSKNSHTLEIRNHGGTMNFKKIRNWLKISIAFCKFVEEFKSDILNKNLNLEYIVTKVFPKTNTTLLNYIQERRELFKTADESVDYVETEVSQKQTIKEVAQCV